MVSLICESNDDDNNIQFITNKILASNANTDSKKFNLQILELFSTYYDLLVKQLFNDSKESYRGQLKEYFLNNETVSKVSRSEYYFSISSCCDNIENNKLFFEWNKNKLLSVLPINITNLYCHHHCYYNPYITHSTEIGCYSKIQILFTKYKNSRNNILNIKNLKKEIENITINDISVPNAIFEKVFQYVINQLKTTYLLYLKRNNFNIENENRISALVNVNHAVKFCPDCHYYGLKIKLPCPEEYIKCENHALCNTITKRKLLNTHLIECNKKLFKCHNTCNGCHEILNPKSLLKHMEECDYTLVSCQNIDCKWLGIKRNLYNHRKIKSDESNWMPWEDDSFRYCKKL